MRIAVVLKYFDAFELYKVTVTDIAILNCRATTVYVES